MAEKKVLLLVADSADFTANAKFAKKAAILPNACTEGLEALALASGAVVSDAAGTAAAFEADAAFVMVKGADIDAAMEATDRRTMLVVAAPNAVAFYGFTVNAKVGEVARAVNAQDILVSIANVADLEISTECTGAIIYQIMKNPNLKLEEIKKLKEALKRMESVLQRDNREPWDKHDCA